jgi:type II secretory pathway pseudopilin PulG
MFIKVNKRRAFTIVELLVASAITLGIVVLLGVIFGSITRTTSRANQRTDAFRDARAALQMMTRDLNNLVRTQWQPDAFTNPPPWQPITRPAAYLALKNIYSDPAPGNQQLYALVAAKNSGLGDVCSVGYYCRWNDQGYGYSLRRFFRPSDKTFNALSSSTTYAADSALYVPDPVPPTGPLSDDLLAANVWNLKVTAYDAAGNALPYPLFSDGSATDAISPTGTARPAAIEISFRAMSAEAARTVVAAQASASVWMDENNATYKLLIKPHAYEFRTRIKL